MNEIVLDHVSHSQFELFDKCARAWMYRYIEHIRTPSSPPLVLGDCYHKILEYNFKYKKNRGEDIDVEFIPGMFVKYWDSVLEKSEINWRDENPNALKEQGIALVCHYIEEVAPTIQPLEVEQWLEAEIAGVKFVIRIDLIDQHGAVIDHKTSSKRYNQKDTDNDMQACATAFAMGRGIVFYNHVALKTSKPQIQILKTYRTQEDIDWWLEKTTATIHAMRLGHYPPRTQGWYCDERYCDFYTECRGHLTKVFIG